jgi:predicted ATPase
MTPGFSRLSVAGYRRLKSVDIALRPLNVLIGANGAGKSSVLDVFDLMAGAAEGNLQSNVSGFGGMASLLTADGKTSSIELGLQMERQEALPLGYMLGLVSEGNGYAIGMESLFEHHGPHTSASVKYIDAAGAQIRYLSDGKLVPPNWAYKTQETALSQVPRTYRDAEGFRRSLADVSEVYHTLDVSSRAPVRTPQILSTAETPGINGDDLVSCLFAMTGTAPDRFEAIEDALRVAFPKFKRLSFTPVGAGRISLGWQDSDFTRPFYTNELSEGTLRFLSLTTLLQCPGLPKVTLIDEPEVSLHPEMLRLLTELMREASARSQLIVATHSDRFVRFLRPDELIVCDLDETGGMITRWADELDLKEWLEDYTLDQLWSQGILGGRS